MGRSKARLLVEGIPLWQHQIQVLEGAGIGEVALVLRARQRSLGDPQREIRDLAPGAGPIAGLHAALAESRGAWLAVLAVDLPFVNAAWFRRLRRHCRRGKGAVVRSRRGFEPLAAIYPRTALAVIDGRLRRGRFALQDLVTELVRSQRLSIVKVPAAERWRVANWNTPADVARMPAPVRPQRGRTA